MRVLFALVCALMAPAVSAQSLKDVIDKYTIAWNTPTEPFKVVGNIYYVGTNGLASYLITGPDGHVLVDTGLREANAQIKRNVDTLGFKMSDIKVMLNTHAHLDHAAGFADLKTETGAQLIAGERDRPLLESGTYPGREDAKELGFPPVKVDRTVKDGDKVTVGTVILTAHATPGHSPGCTSWSLDVKDRDTTRSALIFCSGTVALNKLVGRPTYPGIVEDYKKTFAWARGVKPDIFLAPHPEMFGMAEKRKQIAEGAPNPFVKPGEFNTYVAGLEQAFEASLAKQTADAQGSK